jgi:PAS domain S-box-containing protein
MEIFSENKKIIISSISIAIVSIAIILLFSSTAQEEALKSAHTNISGPSVLENGEEEIYNYSQYLEEEETNWFVTDVSGEYIDVSDDFCNMLGRKAEDIKGTLLFSDINAKDLPAIMSKNSKLLLEAKNVEGLGPYRFMINEEEELLVIFKAIPIVDLTDKKVVKIIFSVKDISHIVEEVKLK